MLDQTVGKEFDVVAISFDPRETPVLAAAKKASYLDRYEPPGSDNGWHFLTGDDANIKRVTDAAGFHFAWDEQTQQFAHASGILVVTPDGRIVALFLRHRVPAAGLEVRVDGIVRRPNRIGGRPGVALLLSLRYRQRVITSLVAMNAVRLGGAVTMAILFGFIAISLRRDGRAPAGH